jgi:hypothetical protein
MLRLAALLSLVTVAYGGGREILTLKDFPDFAVAGKALNLTFTVRMPLEPLADLQPNIRATFCPRPCTAGLATNANVPVANARAKASAAATGEYTAVLMLPAPGDWVITIDTDLAGASVLPPLKVILPGTQAPTPFSPSTRGLRLFSSKGCYACHFHEEVNGGRAYGPDLTGKRFAPEYLKRFLADPSITPVPETVCSRSVCGPPYPMPNLNLKNDEIDDLIAFINKK